MADSVVFSQQQAQRIWAAVRQMERIGRNETGYARARPVTTSEESVYLYNTTGVIIPPYGACVVTNTQNVSTQQQIKPIDLMSGGVVVAVQVPVRGDDDDPDIAVFFNGPKPIPPGQFGKAQTGKTVIVRFQGNIAAPFGGSPPQATERRPIINAPVFASLKKEITSTLSSLEDEAFNLVHYDKIDRDLVSGVLEQKLGYRTIGFPIVRIIAEIEKFENLDGTGGTELPPSEAPTQQPFYGATVPVNDGDEDSFVRFCVAERVTLEESPVFAIVVVDKANISTLDNRAATGRLVYTDNFYRFFGTGAQDNQGRLVTALFQFDADKYFLPSENIKGFRCVLGGQGQFNTTYPIDSDESLSFGGATFGSSTVPETFIVIDHPVPFDCDAVKACLEDEDFDFCDLVAGCLDDEEFHDLICDKVKECLGLEEDEDIDDRIDQRLQELCTCETFIDGVSISGNDWVFTTNEICYVACPDGGGGAGTSIIIEGTDCPEDV
jgi:hypothetical protein